MNKKSIRVMIVDDSAVVRKYYTSIIENSNENIKVVTTANDGKICLTKLEIPKYKPDIILMDIVMPRMDGITTIGHIMDRFPTPIIVVSQLNQNEVNRALSNLGMSAFESGAVEFIRKPDTTNPNEVRIFERELIRKIKSLSPIDLLKVFTGFDLQSFLREEKDLDVVEKIPSLAPPDVKNRVIIIGASTGGPRAISLVLSKFPSKFPPVLIVQHMPEIMMESWVQRLERLYPDLNIKLAKNNDYIKSNTVYVAPGGVHLKVQRSKRVQLYFGEKVNFVIPAIDVTLESAAKVYKKGTLGVVLTGMGKDGTEGARTVKKFGGRIIVEDESTCVIFSMPKHVIQENLADLISPLHNIHSAIKRIGWM